MFFFSLLFSISSLFFENMRYNINIQDSDSFILHYEGGIYYEKNIIRIIRIIYISLRSSWRQSFILRAEFSPFSKYDLDNGAKIENKDDIDEAAYGIAAEFTKDVLYNLELGIGTAYQKHGDFQYKNGYDGEKLPDFNSIPVYITGKYKIFNVGDWTPYIKADLGYSFNDLDDNKYFSYDDRGLYYAVGLGVEIQYLSLEMSYRVNEGKLKTDYGKYDIDNSRVMFGASYRFDF